MAKQDRYVPGPVPFQYDSTALSDEFYNIQVAINSILDGRRDVLYAAPQKPSEGTIAFADGTSWNPGNGAGYYWYSEATASWRYLGMSDFMLEVAKGNIPGHAVVNKFGQNTVLGTSSTETIWDGSNAYTFPVGATITHIRAAADSATTRNMVIEVQGLDTNWALVTQNVTLDGTNSATEVVLGTALRRVFRMKVLDSSSADQNIWVGATGMSAATANGIIQAGNNQTLMAIYTVPASKTAYMTNYYATLNRASGGGSTVGVSIKLWVIDNENGYAKQIKHTVGIDSTADSAALHDFKPYFKVNAKSDIYIEGTNQSGSITADVSAGFDLYLVDD